MPNTMNFMNYLDEVFENVREAIIFIRVEPNNNYRTVLVNKAAMETSGYTPDIVGKLVSEFASPQGYKAMVKQYEKVVRTRKSVEFEHWSNVPIGKEAYSTRLVPVLNALGECSLIVAISEHITPELNREKHLAEVTEDFNAIADTMTEAVIVADKKGSIGFASPNAKEMLEVDVAGKSLFEIVGDDNERQIKKHAKALREGSSLRLVRPCLGPNKPDGIMVYEVQLHAATGKYVVRCHPMQSLKN